MEVKILHSGSTDFPDGDRDWEKMGLTPIGIVRQGNDDQWLALAVDNGRTAYTLDRDWPAPLDKHIAGPAIFQALEEACERLWGHSWNSSVGEIFSLNRRTIQRDRVSKALLPPRILRTIAYVSSADDGKELAEALIAVSRYAGKFNDKENVSRLMQNAVNVFFEDFDRDQ